MSSDGAARAMRASSVELVNFLRHSARDASQRFFAQDLIPEELKRKVEKDSDDVDKMVECLTERVKNSYRDYAVIVGIVDGLQGSSHIVRLLKGNYGKFLLPIVHR